MRTGQMLPGPEGLIVGLTLSVSLAFVQRPGTAAAPQSPPSSRQVLPARAEASIQRALETYTAGDDLAVVRWLETPDGASALSFVEAFLTRRRDLWNRSSAMFVLEAAIAAPARQTFRLPPLLILGRTMVRSPTGTGGGASADTFELLWHQTAVAAAQGWLQYSAQEEYLDAVATRLEDAEHRGVAGETRLPLARAIAAAGACCWRPVHGATIQFTFFSTRRPTVTLDQAVALFERAAERPWLRTEALVRGAVALEADGRHADALTWFARVPAHQDHALGYVHHVTHARVLDAAGRVVDAVAEYEAALGFAPTAQVASIGLASGLLRLGRTDEAAREADKARRLSTSVDGFLEFARADARFVPGWLDALRKQRRR